MIAVKHPAIIPFYHQSECLEALWAAEKIQNTALVLMAGGLGKTILSALYVKSRFDRRKEKRCLYLCHQNDILEQAEVDYRKVFGSEVSYGFFHGDEKTNLRANIIFASFQTLRENLNFYDKDYFDVVVVDETHHSKAETYERTIRYYEPKFLLGISMIGDRSDGLDIREIYGKEVYNLSTVDALVRGLLCPIEYKLMTDEIGSIKQLETVHGRLNAKLLNRTVFVPKRDEEIAAIIQACAKEIKNPRIMVFCSSIEYTEVMAELIPNSVPIHSDVPKTERKVRLELFRKGSFKLATSVDMFNEGLNVPEVNLVVFLRSTSSPAVFFSQLMRGSRLVPGKEKLLILDFVANCERVLTVYELWAKVKTERGQLSTTIEKQSEKRKMSVSEKSSVSMDSVRKSQKVQENELEPFSLNVDEVEFKEKIIPVIETIRKIREAFYQTWQDASAAAIKLGVTTVVEYVEKYKKDSRLVSLPSKYYDDFPGWHKFLGKDRKEFYSTWQEASVAAIQLGIISMRDYGREKKYKSDPKLPVLPQVYYADFPGWYKFLGKEKKQFYPTWQEASAATIKFGVKSSEDYSNKFSEIQKQDKRLHFRPSSYYDNFPGWSIFLNRKDREFYPTWQEASKATIALGIQKSTEYKDKCGVDERLPKVPSSYYDDFPGWEEFLEKEDKYPTWQEASKAVKKLRIKDWDQYRKRYKKDPRLPAALSSHYVDYPGWEKFLKGK